MLVDCFQQMASTLPHLDYVECVFAPREWRSLLVVLPEEGYQCRPDFAGRVEEPVFSTRLATLEKMPSTGSSMRWRSE